MTEEAIKLMEPGAEANDELIARIEQDAELREACVDVLMATTLIACDREQVPDVEAALRRQHLRQSAVRPSVRRGRRYLWAALAAAAVLVGAVFLVRLGGSQHESAPADLIFAAEEGPRQVTAQTSSGETVAMKVVRRHQAADATIVMGQQELQLEEPLVLSVPQGEALQLSLADGTKVYLHPGSRLVYPTKFADTERWVRLSGEAYFCVAPAVGHPFVVETPQGVIRDYGTEFNVNTRSHQSNAAAADDRSAVEVVLVKGSVGVTPNDGTEQLMKPGELCRLTDDGKCSVEEVDVEPYVSWRDGYFHFEEATLRDIVTELARYYNLNVSCGQPDRLHCRMRFIIPRNRPADYAVELLDRMGNAHVSLQGTTIVVE